MNIKKITVFAILAFSILNFSFAKATKTDLPNIQFMQASDIGITLVTLFAATTTNFLRDYYNDKNSHDDTIDLFNTSISSMAGVTTISLLAINAIYCVKIIRGALNNLMR